MHMHLFVCYLNKLQNARCNNKDRRGGGWTNVGHIHCTAFVTSSSSLNRISALKYLLFSHSEKKAWCETRIPKDCTKILKFQRSFPDTGEMSECRYKSAGQPTDNKPVWSTWRFSSGVCQTLCDLATIQSRIALATRLLSKKRQGKHVKDYNFVWFLRTWNLLHNIKGQILGLMKGSWEQFWSWGVECIGGL
jgi:hypothetical protein